LFKIQWNVYPALSIQQSTLGEAAGLGLFARRDISTEDNDGVLCRFFGKIVVATEEQVSLLHHFKFKLTNFDISFPEVTH
jgi:hypothetical protein